MAATSVAEADAGKAATPAAEPPKLPPAADEEFRSAPANLTALSRPVLAWLETPRDWESWPVLPFQFASASARPRRAFLPGLFSFFRRSTARGRRSQARRRRRKSSREKGEAGSRARA